MFASYGLRSMPDIVRSFVCMCAHAFTTKIESIDRAMRPSSSDIDDDYVPHTFICGINRAIVGLCIRQNELACINLMAFIFFRRSLAGWRPSHQCVFMCVRHLCLCSLSFGTPMLIEMAKKRITARWARSIMYARSAHSRHEAFVYLGPSSIASNERSEI